MPLPATLNVSESRRDREPLSGKILRASRRGSSPRFLQATRRIAEVQARHLRGVHVEIGDGDAADEERGYS